MLLPPPISVSLQKKTHLLRAVLVHSTNRWMIGPVAVQTSIAHRVLRLVKWILCSILAQADRQNPAPSQLLISMPFTPMLRQLRRTTPLLAAGPIGLELLISPAPPIPH